MVFPSLMFNVEPGVVSQFSAMAVVIFSFMVHRLRKLILVGAVVLASFFIYQSQARAYAAMPHSTYQQWGNPYFANNYNYYGRPWGQVPPAYFYPQLQYHSLWGPTQPYYFRPHPVSPYSPNYNCPYCNQYNPNTQPGFPYPNIHPGGGAS